MLVIPEWARSVVQNKCMHLVVRCLISLQMKITTTVKAKELIYQTLTRSVMTGRLGNSQYLKTYKL